MPILQEKRKFDRYRVPVNVDAVIGDKIIQSTIRDICCGGLFIPTTGVKIKNDDKACVVFALPKQDKPVKLYGKSVRTEPAGVAIQFQGITPYVAEVMEQGFLAGGIPL